MKFKIGKSYEHNCGEQLYIVGEVDTILYGKCLIGEVGKSKKQKIKKEYSTDECKPCECCKEYFRPISNSEDASQNYYEIPLELFKLSNFELGEKEKKYCQRQLKLKRIINETYKKT